MKVRATLKAAVVAFIVPTSCAGFHAHWVNVQQNFFQIRSS